MFINSNLKNNIWIINLDKSIDRMSRIKKNFDKYGIKFNRFSAIYGKNLSKRYIKNNVNFLCKSVLCNYGTIGCAISHKTLWKQLIDSNEDFYIIFEDDIEINNKTFDIINKIIPFLNNKELDIDYINLNCINSGYLIHKTKFSIDNYEFSKPYLPLLCNSYIITKKGACKLIDAINKTIYHVDFEILMVNLFKKFNYYSSNIPLVKLTMVDTTIGSKRKSLILALLNYLNLNYIAWLLNIPIFTINLFYEITLLIVFLFLLYMLNIYYIKNKIITGIIILELFLYNL